MKFHCKYNILPTVDTAVQVFWNILNQNVINFTFLSIILTVQAALQALVSLRYTLLEDQFVQMMSNWEEGRESQDEEESGIVKQAENNIPSFLLKISIAALILLVVKFCCLACLFRHFKNGNRNLSTTMQLVTKFLGLGFTLIHLGFAVPFNVCVLLPLVMISVYPSSMLNQQITVSTILIVLYILSFYIFQRLIVLRFRNNKVPWSQPRHLVIYLDFIFNIFLVIFCFQNNVSRPIQILYQIIFLLITMLKLVLQLQNPLYYNKNIAFYKYNLDALFLSYYFSQLLLTLMQVELQSLVTLFLLSLLCFMSLANLAMIRMKEKLIIAVMNDNIKSSKNCETAIYILLDMIQTKDNLLNNQYDGILLAIEQNLPNTQELSFYSQLIALYEQENSQSPDQNGLLIQETRLTGNAFQQQLSMNPSFMMTSVMTDTHKAYILPFPNQADTQHLQVEQNSHQLIDCFNFDQQNQRRLGDLEYLNQERDFQRNSKRNRSEQIKLVKISFLVEQLLNPFLHRFPKSVSLMFLKCYLSLLFQKNRFLCLTMITQIENLNKKSGYLDQVESKISQQFFLDIFMLEQSKEPDQVDSTFFLEMNLKMNKYFELLSTTAQKIQDFWQLFSTNSTYKQVLQLERSSFIISNYLGRIKQSLKTLESDTVLTTASTQVHYYTAIFYQMALRDFYLSNQYVKKIQAQKHQLTFSSNQKQLAGFDEALLIIVDGDFQKMGRILYVNKVLEKTLNYLVSEVEGRTVHVLMPRDIAQVHDRFWNNFKQTGIPSILERQRILFVKNKQGYVSPQKIFVKFMYHQVYGYAYLGIFKQPKTIIMSDIERPIGVQQIMFLIAKPCGRVVEVSESCKKMIGLSVQVLEALSGFLDDGLNVSHFNDNLFLNNFDFLKNSTVVLNQLPFDASIISRYSKELEFENVFLSQKHKTRHNACIKIVKESYGQDEITLFYFMVQLLSDSHTPQTNQDINKNHLLDMDVTSFESEHQSPAIVPGDKSSFEQRNTQSNLTSSTSSITFGESLQSLSSNNNFEELKYLEDNIDYSKTPKSLLFVKLIFNSVFLLIIALTTSLIILNSSQKAEQMVLIEIVKQSQESQAYLSQLTLLTRSYANIDQELEPKSTPFFEDRLMTIKNTSFELIEQMRLVQKDLSFFNSTNQFDEEGFNVVKMKEVLYNLTVIENPRAFDYAFNNFLIKALEIFNYDTIGSKLVTFLKESTDRITYKDQTAFYVLFNSNGDLKEQIENFSNFQRANLLYKNEKYLNVTKTFMIVASCTIFVAVLTALYFYSKIVENQTRMLSFFSELRRELIEICYNGSRDFHHFMITDKSSIVAEDIKSVHKVREGQKKQKESPPFQTNEADYYKRTNTKFDTVDGLKGGHQNHLIEELKDEEDDEQEQTNINKRLSVINVASLKNKVHTEKQQTSKHNVKELKKRAKEVQEPSENKFETGEDEFKDNQQEAANEDLFKIFMQWKVKKMGTYSICFLLISAIFVAYFIVQFFLVQRFQIKMKEHTEQLEKIYDSQACLNDFLSDLRQMQSLNSTLSDDSYQFAYNECIRSNQKLFLWLDGRISNQEVKETYQKFSEPEGICQALNRGFDDVQEEDCNQIYSGIFQKTLAQAGSVFLHDSLQQYVSFTSAKDKNPTFLRRRLNNSEMINMIDAQLFFYQKAIQTLSATTHSALKLEENTIAYQQLYIFGVYLIALVAFLLIMNCLVFVQMRKSIWNSKIIFKLLPYEDLDICLKRRVQQFLFKP